MENKKVLLGFTIFMVVLALIAGIYLIFGGNKKKSAAPLPVKMQNRQLPSAQMPKRAIQVPTPTNNPTPQGAAAAGTRL